MKTKTIISTIDLLISRLEEDRIDCHGDDDDCDFYKKEIDRLEESIDALYADVKPQPCELIDIKDGEAHVVGYFEYNLNDDGPQPVRYVEVCGCLMPYEELAKANIADVEAECKQYVQDGGECRFREFVESRRLVTCEQFKEDGLGNGEYAVFWCDDED